MAAAEQLKRKAADDALEYVKPGMVLGLGTGSTARLFLEGVARLVESVMDLKAVPTSLATAEAAKKLGIPLTSLACPCIKSDGGTKTTGPIVAALKLS